MGVMVVLLVHAAATLVMTGIIWFVQIVHYPLFAAVGPHVFHEYQARHLALTGRVVMPAMLLELSTGVLLVGLHPTAIPTGLRVMGVVLLVLVWGSTFLLQVPRHRILERGFDRVAWQGLVRTNWIRTVVWSCRGILVMLMVALEVVA